MEGENVGRDERADNHEKEQEKRRNEKEDKEGWKEGLLKETAPDASTSGGKKEGGRVMGWLQTPCSNPAAHGTAASCAHEGRRSPS